MQSTVKLTLRIPAGLHEKLRQRARQTDRSLNTVAVDIMREGLLPKKPAIETEDERFERVLRESGLWEPLGPQWIEGLEDVTLLTHEELQEELRGVPPLSEIIIEERGLR
ncbi:MAG: hypothetical protein COY47_07265 [Chloroflexi bacterium CG_4_10_14_0_8_um_filter_57_5]|nr:MAG: hypothetical protein COY47_07265 [Chloroflexi bacterium CG_4_10_14_0_8_um_filter_57_5]